MSGDCMQAVMEGLRICHCFGMHPVENPQGAVTIDGFFTSKRAQGAIAGKENPGFGLCKREGKAVRKR